ncbi:MAG: hypothetical protein QXF56_00180 [Candidatus Micrarchaeia archaeon]
MRGQTAVELVVILAVSLLILFVIISISSQYLAELSSSKAIVEARNSVDELASTAKQVYYQGEGAKKQVFIKIPEGVNPQKTGISERTIVINVLGTDVVARTDFDVRGRIPTTPGGYIIWVTAKKGYVLIGTASLTAEPSAVFLHFFSENETQSTNTKVIFRNDGETELDVELNMSFPEGNVNVSLSNPADKNFHLLPGEFKEVWLDVFVEKNVVGTYSGVLYANASNGDELAVPITVDVTSQLCIPPTCPATGVNCTPHYMVIETFNDTSYTALKDVFDPSEDVVISGSGWEPLSQVSVDIKNPVGVSVAGYPKIVGVNSEGIFSDTWNTAGGITGTYTVRVNDSAKERVTTFNITACT